MKAGEYPLFAAANKRTTLAPQLRKVCNEFKLVIPSLVGFSVSK